MLRGFSKIVITPGVRSGKACIVDTRITVADILGWLSIGMSFTEIIEDFPELSEESIKQALAYAADREKRTLITAAWSHENSTRCEPLLQNCQSGKIRVSWNITRYLRRTLSSYSR